MSVTADRRFTAKHPCPICGGHAQLPQGQGKRCYGYLADDGGYAHCTREDKAGGLPPTQGESNTYAHRLTGGCKCGTSHDGRPSVARIGPLRQPIKTTWYLIKDTEGTTQAKHKRVDFDDGDKSFTFHRPDGTPGLDGRPKDTLPLYGSHLLSGRQGEPVIVTEGEKAADALNQTGRLALATVTGEGGTPVLDVLRPLVGREVYLWPDNDPDGKGRRHMERIAVRLSKLGIEPYLIEWADAPPKGDAYDFIAKCGSNGALDLLIKNAKGAKACHTSNNGTLGSLREDWQPSWQGVTLLDVQPEEIEWRSRGRQALGKLAIWDGDPGLGKSTAAADWMAKVTRGQALPDGDPFPPAGVVLLSAEDGIADTIRPRLEAAGADLSRVLVITGIPDGDSERLPSLPEDIPAIEDAIQQIGAELLVIDPLMAYLSGQVNSYRDQDVRRALAPLAAMAERRRCAVIIIRHINKNGQANPLYRGGGSIGIIGAARFGLLVAADPDDSEKRVLASTKCNIGKKPATLSFRLESVVGTDVARVSWLGESHHTAASVLAQPEDEDDRTASADATTVLREILSGGPLSAKTVKDEARDAGISERTLWRAKKTLGVVAKKAGFGGGWVWELPKAANDARSMPSVPYVDDGSLRQPSESMGDVERDHARRLMARAHLRQGHLDKARSIAREIVGNASRREIEDEIEAAQASAVGEEQSA